MRIAIEDQAARLGLQCATWAPGDGIERYRFAQQGEPGGYFGWAHPLVTCLGAREAGLWLRGYAAGYAEGFLDGAGKVTPAEQDLSDPEADVRREEDRIEAGQARWAETGTSRKG